MTKEQINTSVSYWAKKFDTVSHIINPDTNSVLCGEYNALLGNNYAWNTNEVCSCCADLLLNKPKNKKNHGQS